MRLVVISPIFSMGLSSFYPKSGEWTSRNSIIESDSLEYSLRYYIFVNKIRFYII